MKINIVDTLFPNYCVLCKRVGESICTTCIKNKIFVNWNTYCCVCNSKVKLGLIHRECRDQTYLDGHFFVTSYSEGVKELIMQGKYSFNYANFEFIGELMAKFLKLYNLEPPVIIPIPLTNKKKRTRGFNQSEIISKRLSLNTAHPHLNLLKKIKDQPAQAELGGEERRLNLKDCFVVDEKLALKLDKESPILLVDDVFTTGSTLNECAKTLRNSGFTRIYGYTFAKAGRV